MEDDKWFLVFPIIYLPTGASELDWKCRWLNRYRRSKFPEVLHLFYTVFYACSRTQSFKSKMTLKKITLGKKFNLVCFIALPVFFFNYRNIEKSTVARIARTFNILHLCHMLHFLRTLTLKCDSLWPSQLSFSTASQPV